jgi:hypothetical protein
LFLGVSSSSKNIKKCEKHLENTDISHFQGIIKNHQKPSKTLRVYIHSFFLGIYCSYENYQKTSKTHRVYIYFPFLRGFQKPSKTAQAKPLEYTVFLFFEEYPAPPKP